MHRAMSSAASAPIGRLIRNTQRQSKLSVSQPPRTGPAMGPIITPAPKIAIAVPCFSRGLMSNNVAWASGTMNAPATPWTARNSTISVRFWATAHSKDAPVKTITDQTNNGLRPILSASQPVIGMAMAEATI